MNIRIPHDWLLEHLETEAKPTKIQECLSLCGPSIERIETVDGEPVYEVEVTTNRVDCMSVRGIAREAVAILPEFDIKARLLQSQLPRLNGDGDLGMTIISDPALCKRILAVKISGVKIGPSPSWLQKRLRQVGQRPLNNAIDITNLVMWEIGHPVHVFDYDRLRKKTIIVREAKAGEALVTLDGKKHSLRGGEVVFDDGTGEIVDLPGVMGTLNSVVTQHTKNILVWIESIVADRIRLASMGLAIRSQAAILNEKGVDTELGLPAMQKAVLFYRDIASPRSVSKLTDMYPVKPKPQTIRLKQELLDAYMGKDIAPQKVRRILTNLGCTVTRTTPNRPWSMEVIPPSWRVLDLTMPEDIIEEVARIAGYQRLPTTLMSGKLPLKTQGIPFHLEDDIKDHLVDWGLTEVYTYSLVSRELAELSGISLRRHLRLSNPLSEEHLYLRRSIIPSHLVVLAGNRQRPDLAIFELANVYQPSRGTRLPREILQLVITVTGPYDRAKVIIEMLLKKLRVRGEFIVPEKPMQVFGKNRAATIIAGGNIIGAIGEINDHLLKEAHLEGPITAISLQATELLEVKPSHPSFASGPIYPPIIEDFTFAVPEKTHIGDMINEIHSASRLVDAVYLKERYRQNATFTLSFRHPLRSLTDQDVRPARKKIVQHLKKHFQARLVGEIH